MADDISVKIGVEGETKFKKALTECQNTVKQLDSALKANAAEYENNADALGENVEKTRLLKQSIEAQKKLIDEMGDAIKYATEQYGAASRQTTRYVVAQNNAKEALAKLERGLRGSDRELEEMGRDSQKVGRQLEQGIGDGARDAAKSIEEMYEELKRGIGEISGSVGVSAAFETLGGVGNVLDGINDIVEGTRETRRNLAYLGQNAEDAGMDWTFVKGQMDEVVGITGETEGAIEGISNLLATGFNTSQMETAIDSLAGAVIRFPGTYKFETLAEDLRNTVQEKKATGQFAEVLSALGADVEAFNTAMSQTTTTEEALQVALSALANHGLEKTKKGFEDNNKELVKANQTAAGMDEAWATLAGEMTDVGTAWTEMQTAAIGAVAALLEDSQVDEWIAEKIGDITELIRLLSTEEGRLEMKRKALEGRGETYGTVDAETEMENLKKAIEEVKMTGDTVLLYSLEGRLAELEAAAETGKEIGETLIEETQKAIEESGEEASAAGADTGEAIVEGATGALEDGGEDVKTAIANMIIEGSKAFGEQTPGIVAAARSLTNGISEALSGIVWPDWSGQLNTYKRQLNTSPVASPGGGGVNVREVSSTGGNPALQISMNIDGTKVANAIVKPMSNALGRMTITA